MENTIPIIHKTLNYSSFKRMEGNRNVGHKDKIIKSIRSVGYIVSPIICNENMEIVDGQGRFEACVDLGLPIYFIVIDGLGINHCRSMNISSTNWSIRDFVQSYAQQGNENYVNLIRLMERHPSISMSVVCAAAAEDSIGVDNETIKTGRLKIDNFVVPNADKICYWLDENVMPYKAKISGRFDYLCLAMIFAYEHTTADRERLAQIVKTWGYDFTPIASVKHGIEQIERYYNKNLHKNKVYFLTEYDKYLVSTNGAYDSRWSINARNRKMQERLESDCCGHPN